MLVYATQGIKTLYNTEKSQLNDVLFFGIKNPCKVYSESTKMGVHMVLVSTYETLSGIKFAKIGCKFVRIAHKFVRIAHKFVRIACKSIRIARKFVRIAHKFARIAYKFNKIAHKFNKIAHKFARIVCNFVAVGFNENSVDAHNRQRRFMPPLFCEIFKMSVMNKKINVNESVTKIVCLWERKESNTKSHFGWHLAGKASKKFDQLIYFITFKNKEELCEVLIICHITMLSYWHL
jgi:hypothetical protein